MMDDTLMIISFEPMRMVTRLNRKSLRASEKSEHHNVPEKIRKSFPVPVYVSYVNRKDKRRRTEQRKEIDKVEDKRENKYVRMARTRQTAVYGLGVHCV